MAIMALQFSTAKNGEKTCSLDNVFIHSKYNPSQEAKNWIFNLKVDFVPKNIIVLGACIPYCTTFLHERFPNAQIILFQYDKVFESFSDNENFVSFFISKSTDDVTICEALFDYLGEEDANRTFVISYFPSEKAFPEQFQLAQNGVQKYIKKSIDVIGTRVYFSKKWFYNSLRFFKNLKNTAFYPQKCNQKILIAASGPTLKDSLPYIKKFRDNFFLLSVSSATKVLLEASILPDSVITTDGGFWAKKHLDILKNHKEIPLICSTESALPYFAFDMNIVPIEYSDFFQKMLFEKSGVHSIHLERNGTVTGCAINFALNFTDNEIYTVGMDLEKTKGFIHTMPNNLEILDSLKDNRLCTTEKRITKSNVFSQSLEVYKNYFSTMDKKYAQRIKRLCTKSNVLPQLGFIKTELWSDFECQNKSEQKTSLKNLTIQTTEKNCYTNIINYLSEITLKIEKTQYNESGITDIEISEFFKIFALPQFLNYQKFKMEKDFFATKEKTLTELKKIAENYVDE